MHLGRPEPALPAIPHIHASSLAPQARQSVNALLQLPFYEHELVDQAGHICKPAALANLDRYYAARYGIANVPLRKNALGRYPFEYRNRALLDNPANESLSIRQIAKRHGSLQGEVLCRQTLRDIGQELGYDSRELRPRNVSEFLHAVNDALGQSIPVFICYAMGADRLPSLLYRDNPSNEHAGLIVGYHAAQSRLTIASDGRLYHDLCAHRLWRASRALPPQRGVEHYLKPSKVSTHDSSQPKYIIPLFGWGIGGAPNVAIERLIQAQQIQVHATPVLAPPDSGFQGVLILFTPAVEHERWRAPQCRGTSAAPTMRYMPR